MRTKKNVAKHGFNLVQGKRQIAKAKVALQDAASDAKEKFLDAKDKLVDVEKNVVSYTKENPIKAMGLSLLAGVVLAQILHLRK